MSQCPILKFRNKIQSGVKKYGCMVPYVSGEGLAYAYSVGIEKSFGAPEVIVFALSGEMGQHFVVNEYMRRVKEGERFQHMQHTGGFLMDFECLFIKVHARYYGKFLPCCADYYGGKGFRALQMVIPSTEGFWPWEDAQVAKREPILGTCNVSMVKKNLRGVCR